MYIYIFGKVRGGPPPRYRSPRGERPLPTTTIARGTNRRNQKSGYSQRRKWLKVKPPSRIWLPLASTHAHWVYGFTIIYVGACDLYQDD